MKNREYKNNDLMYDPESNCVVINDTDSLENWVKEDIKCEIESDDIYYVPI